MSPDELEGLPEEQRPQRARERRRGLRGPAKWVVLGIFLALLVGFAGVLLLTQSDRGRSQVLAFTLRTLGGRLSGDLEIERIEGNLFAGAWVYGLRLSDYDGTPLATVDSAFLRYRIPTLVGGDVVLPRAVLYNASIDLLRMPGDSLWNYQRILTDPDPGPEEGPPGATFIEQLELHDSRITIRGPFGEDPTLTPEEQQLAIEDALADTARWMIESVPGGYLRTMLLDVPFGRINELFISPDERGGNYLEVEELVSDVRLWRDPPLEIRSLQGQLHLREGILNFTAPSFTLPDSRGEIVGRIDLSGERPMYDVVITTPALALADLRWLYPWLPDEPGDGVASGRLWVEDRPEELLVLARDLVLDLPGTRIVGQVGLLTGDVPRFVNVDLEAEPLDMESVELLLPDDLPIDGLEIRSAVIRGE